MKGRGKKKVKLEFCANSRKVVAITKSMVPMALLL
jgi:hypothetical protein